METKISANQQKKQTIVQKLTRKVDAAKALIFTNYQGLTHVQLEGFKKALRQLEAEFVIGKNTLLKIALGKDRIAGKEAEFAQPTGTLFLYGDPVAPLKALAKLIKELNLPSVKFGILNGQALNSQQVLKLATLPSREMLLTQLAVGLKSPISNLHRALNWNLQKFVLTLKAIENQKKSKLVANPA